MSNRFLCNFSAYGNFNTVWTLQQRFLNQKNVYVRAYNFFYCAEPLATSASIQNVRTNLREYCVKRIKINCCVNIPTEYDDYIGYMMVFVLNVPDNYVPSKIAYYDFRLSDLPNHTIPECVLYYNLYRGFRQVGASRQNSDIRIDIKKQFKVLPSHKLVFVYYVFSNDGGWVQSDGTAEVFFEVN